MRRIGICAATAAWASASRPSALRQPQLVREVVGELVRLLDDKGLSESTLFVYVNDNGWEQGPHQEFLGDGLRWNNGGDKGKLSMHDQSFRTPVIFAQRGRIPGGGATTG